MPTTISDKARELHTYARNTASLQLQYLTISRVLKKRKANGTYDHNLAAFAWAHWVDTAAKAYHREFGSRDFPWHKLMPPDARREAALAIADEWLAEFNANGWEGI